MNALAAPEDVSGATLVGILGGMGPAATADFYLKLINATPAAKDQDHIRTVIWSDPTVPDRSAALVGDGEDPTPSLVRGARRLAGCGASFIVIPCNTAHAFRVAIEQATGVPVLDMIAATVDVLGARVPTPSAVGVLATDGTLSTDLYREALTAKGYRSIEPQPEIQLRLMDALAMIKAGDVGWQAQAGLGQAATHLVGRGADVLIAGCTEVVLGLRSDSVSVPVIDPAQVLAELIVKLVYPER